MKQLTLFAAVGVALCIGIYFFQNNDNASKHRTPTDGTIVRTDQSEDEGNANRREQYFELMHRAAPDTDWRAIDQQTREQQYLTKLNARQLKSSMPIESFGNGALQGEWFERGSKDQSGSIRAIDYDVDTDKIYLISDGGTVWKGSRTGNDWTPQNEDLQFDRKIIQVVDNGSGGKRLLACLNKVVHYSDDDGLSWQPSGGFNFYDSWGDARSMYVMNDANNTIYYLALTWDATPWAARMWLFRSTDNGLTFSQIHAFLHGDANQISMWSPFDSNELYILNKSNTLHQVVGTSVTTLNTNNNLPTGSDNHLRGHKSGTTLTLYALINRSDIYRSTNNGASWNLQGTLPANAWEIGIDVSLNNANRLYAGEVDAFRSFNGGSSWTRVNNWWEYYGDVLGKLHADMMAFASFYDPSGNAFTLTANHGGISISYDNMVTNTNIAMQNLNVSQYYDVVTSDANVNYMYAGTQDQGFQRSNTATSTAVANWEQPISGDYGHMIFSNNGQSLWTQYPGGVMDHYVNPRTGYSNASWTMPGNNLPSYGWMLPSAETANYSDNSMYIGGGELNGGNGNYLIKLTYAFGNITATQGNYNFKSNANGAHISAVEASTLDAGRIYVAMDNGTFFYSNDTGASWTKTNAFSGPGNWYLYGASVLASDVTSNVVYYGGSGYSNPAVYKSTNGGVSFTAMSNGLPNTLVHELAANADESLLFAATEVGPYVYVAAQNQWFDMRGLSAPMQRYTSVEYIDSEEVVRFGTYGRGTWDFKVSACATMDLAINFDDNPVQTSWEIVDTNNNNVVASGGNYSSNPSGSSVSEAACLPDGCYELVVYDSANDGMCPRRTTTVLTGINIANIGLGGVFNGIPRVGLSCGDYTLTDSEGNVLATGGGRFGSSETNTFCITNGVQTLQSDGSFAYMRQSVNNDNTPDMALLPNLVRDQLTVRYTLATDDNVQINILNANGQVIQQHTPSNRDAQDMLLNVSDLSQGFYFAQLISGDMQVVRKFVKQ